MIGNRNPDGWPHRIARAIVAVGVRTKIIGIALGVTLLLGLSAIGLVRSSVEEQLLAQLHETGEAVAHELAANVSVRSGSNGSVFPPGLAGQVALHEGIVFVGFSPASTEVIVEALIVRDALRVEAFLAGLPGGGSPHDHGSSDDGVMFHVFRAPVEGTVPGTLLVGLSQNVVDRSIAALTSQLLILMGAVAAVAIAGAGALTWYLTRPLNDLLRLTERVGNGDLSARATPWATDELGALVVSFNDMTEKLESARVESEAHEQARRALLQELMTAQEEERRRISQILHDSVGQSLSSLSFGMSHIENFPDEAPVRVSQLRAVAVRVLEQVREISHELRPAALDAVGLGAALTSAARDYEEANDGLVVEVRVQLDERLPAELETTLYRVIQEALRNAVRHSGAGLISISVARYADRIRAIVEDDGAGFASSDADGKLTVGLHSMSERARMVGGNLQVETSGSGTTVYIEVPL